jgi:hypothetical protein
MNGDSLDPEFSALGKVRGMFTTIYLINSNFELE